MPSRELVYPPVYSAELFVGGDIRLSFHAPGSKLGPVFVVLAADDAECLNTALVKAIDASAEMLAAEALSVERKEPE